jgi:hypothetical protein
VGLSASPVLAAGNASTQFSVSLSGGPLLVATPSAAAYSLTLDGTDQAQSQPLTLEPADETGTGNGWAVTVSSSPLETSAGSVVPLTWALGINGSTADPTSTAGLEAWANGSGTYAMPVPAPVSYPVSVPGLSGGPLVPSLVYGAQVNSGLGSFAVSLELWLSVPANALAGSYTSTVTWTIVSGPSGTPG